MLQGYSGIPPAEGLIGNTKVISFDHPHMRELYGDDSIALVENNNVEAFAEAIVNEFLFKPNKEGNEKLMNGNLYMKTQDQLAMQYSRIFQGLEEKYES